jgi:hypothetical protein
MRLAGLSLALSGAVLGAAPASAHHSHAMYDESKLLTLTGTVVRWEWTNPHSWLEMQVAGADGQRWSLETSSPSMLSRTGMSRTSLKPGDKVVVTAHPRRDKTFTGHLQSVNLNGKALALGARDFTGAGRD